MLTTHRKKQTDRNNREKLSKSSIESIRRFLIQMSHEVRSYHLRHIVTSNRRNCFSLKAEL